MGECLACVTITDVIITIISVIVVITIVLGECPSYQGWPTFVMLSGRQCTDEVNGGCCQYHTSDIANCSPQVHAAASACGVWQS